MPTVVYSIDHEKADDALGSIIVTLRNAVAHAVAVERERCAVVVENMGRRNGRITKTHKVIAAEIRSARNRIGNKKRLEEGR